MNNEMNQMKTNETNHAPGPWRVAKHDALRYTFHVDAGPAGYERKRIAIVSGESVKDCAEANANLMALAPEFLEALEMALGPLQSCYNDAQRTGLERAEAARAFLAVKAAIAKVRLDAAGLELHNAAVALASERGILYADALSRIAKARGGAA